MAWATINGHRYYRRSRRVNGRVTTEHIGGGEFGDVMAELDQMERLERRLDADLERAARVIADESMRAAIGVGEFFADLFAVLARQSGYHQHRRQWRRTRRAELMSAELQKQLKKLGQQIDRMEQRRHPLVDLDFTGIPEEDRATLQAAAKGDKAALAKAQPYLTDPAFIKRWGNPMYAARCWLVTQVAGEDAVQTKLIHGRVKQLQDELGFEAANTLERIAITRIVHNWLAVAALESKACQAGFQGRERAGLEKCLSQAERRLMQAVKTLAFLREISVPALMTRIGEVTTVDPIATDN